MGEAFSHDIPLMSYLAANVAWELICKGLVMNYHGDGLENKVLGLDIFPWYFVESWHIWEMNCWVTAHILLSQKYITPQLWKLTNIWSTKVNKLTALTHFHSILLGHDTYERWIVGSRHTFWYHKSSLRPVILVINDWSLMINLTQKNVPKIGQNSGVSRRFRMLKIRSS